MQVQSYRADIDGLRAIAVLSVVVFHVWPQALPGGFTGVDVFFVIPGFLITGLIDGEIAKGTFSIGRKPKLTPEQVVLALRLVDEGQSVPQVADAFGVHETTIYRCLSAAEAAA
jgi:hypothetical protein